MLIDEIKPEILVELDKNYEQYNTSVNFIYNTLATKQVYSQLSIYEIKDIVTFAELDFSKWSGSDILFGDKILNNNN